MKHIIYDAQTGKTTITEVPDEEMPVIEETSAPTVEDRITALEGTTGEIIETLNTKGLIP